MPHGRPPSLLDQPSYLAGQVARYGRRSLEAVLEERGLGLVHHAVLSALDDFGPLSQQQLADGLDLHKSHVVGPIDELERRGWVVRARDAADRRRNRVALTAAGAALAAELQPVARRAQEGVLEPLSQREQRKLVSLLQRVLAANDESRLAASERLRA